MSLGLGLGLALGRNAIVLPPVVANQSFDYGDHSLAGAGGFTPASTGGSITSLSIDSGDASGHFQVLDDGTSDVRIAITSAGRTAGLSGSPYSLGITATGPGGSDTATITITAVANGWSVRDATELRSAGQDTTDLAYGDTIYLRTGRYNTDKSDIRIKRSSAAPAGTFAAPSLKTDNDQGYDLSTGTWVTITKHAGENPVIEYIQIDANVASASYFQGFRFTDMTFGWTIVSNDGGSGAAALKGINGGSYDWHLAVDNCTFIGDAASVDTSTGSSLASGIRMNNGGNYLYFQDNTFSGAFYDGITVSTPGSPNEADNITIVGNTIRDVYNDAIKLSAGSNQRINWNLIYDKKHLDSALGTHADFIQVLGADADANVDNIRFIGNRIFRGEGSATRDDGQGIFMGGFSGVDVTNLVIEGNFIMNSMRNGISVGLAVSPIIRYNTVISDADNYTLNAQISLNSCNAGTVQYNIAEQINDNTPVVASTVSDNTLCDVTLSDGTAQDYDSLFDNPLTGSSVTAANVETLYAIKSGGAADTASPKNGAIGTGYVNYSARTTAFPSTFTEYTVDTNAEAQLRLDGADSPTATKTMALGIRFEVNSFPTSLDSYLWQVGGRGSVRLYSNGRIVIVLKDTSNSIVYSQTSSTGVLTTGVQYYLEIICDNATGGSITVRLNGSIPSGISETFTPTDTLLEHGNGVRNMIFFAGPTDVKVTDVFFSGSDLPSVGELYNSGTAFDYTTLGYSPEISIQGPNTEWNVGTQDGSGTLTITGNFADADATAPVLTSATDAATGATTSSWSVDTDIGTGTLYWVVTTSSTTPTDYEIVAGEDHTGTAATASGSQAVSATGTQNGTATGLTSATTYYTHFAHRAATTYASATPVSASGFTTS